MGDLGDIVWAKKPAKLSVVFTREEVKSVLSQLSPKGQASTYWTKANLLYGAGLRLVECLRLRVNDIDFNANMIMVHDAKGQKDRRTVLPAVVKEPLQRHLLQSKKLFLKDREENSPGVQLPYALERKYPNAGRSRGWFTPRDSDKLK